MILPYGAKMVRGLIQALAVAFMIFVVSRYVIRSFGVGFIDVYWREVSFAFVSVVAAWLFVVTQSLRPVVAVFAAIAFFVVAKTHEPSTANFFAVLDALSDRILTGIQVLRQG